MADGLIIPSRLIGAEILNCPITAVHRAVVSVDYCKTKCRFFIKFIEDDKAIECSYPRRIEIISQYGGEGKMVKD